MRKTALLAGVAGLFLTTAPAFAQEATAPQTPPAATPAAPTLTLQPGATVRGSDGDLGVLVGARLNGGRQQLTVEGADGVIRAVPIDGIRQEGDVVVVDFTVAQFGAADAVTGPATPATPAEPGATPATPASPATPAAPGNPNGDGTDEDAGDDPVPTATPATPATPADPGVSPATPATRATPPSQSPAAPRPGEGQANRPG